MLHRHILILHTGRQVLSQLEHIVYPLGDIKLICFSATGDPGQLVKLRLCRRLQALHCDAQLP